MAEEAVEASDSVLATAKERLEDVSSHGSLALADIDAKLHRGRARRHTCRSLRLALSRDFPSCFDLDMNLGLLLETEPDSHRAPDKQRLTKLLTHHRSSCGVALLVERVLGDAVTGCGASPELRGTDLECRGVLHKFRSRAEEAVKSS